MRLLKPIKDEEWIEKFRDTEFWIGAKRSYPQKFYSRLTHSYVGWWIHLRLHFPPFRHFFLNRLSLLVDPLSSGGLYSHVRSFLFNFVIADIWWSSKHRVWKLFHREEHEARLRFMRAAMQATQEGCADEMPPPPGFCAANFHGAILGERYFKRVAEILDESNGPQKPGSGE
jgi:hypothetical protein